jgi:Nif-specific regulatory protein
VLDDFAPTDCRSPAYADILAWSMGAREDRLGLERDLYAHLLEARSGEDPVAALTVVLELLVAATNAQRAYLEIYPAHDRARPHWTISHGCSSGDESEIRAATSRGIVAAALASGTTLHTPYAALDDRFAALPSVREQRLEAVLCVPTGGVGGGILYLEGRHQAGPFGAADVQLAERVARHVWPCVDRAAHADRLASRLDPTRPYRDRLRLDGVVGRSVALAQVFGQLEPYAPLDVTILITGASGTGKTQIARAIHDNSPRRNGPFVELNCAAIPEGLIESELFGTMPSAFPGARRTTGKVEAAEGGTLFLDEIVEIPFSAQGKLLQLLQSRQYYALASTKLATANIRLIVATNADLEVMVAERRFREDLYYRINVINLRMPSLAERREDVSVMVDELLTRIAAEHHLPRIGASSQFRAAMESRDWPGNVRQLRHRLESALIRACSEGAPQIETRHLPDAPAVAERTPTFHEATRLYQRELLRRELEASDWNVAAVAERLEITRSHIYNLIHQLGIQRTQDRRP